MIPPDAKARIPRNTLGKRISTQNARREGMAKSWTYGHAWQQGQRCLIPADIFYEPNWESGEHVRWRFSRRDGKPWALAGLWSIWIDPATGEAVPNFTMVTQNCDAHPLLNRMHKPDPAFAPDQQDKRGVVPIEPAQWDEWLNGSRDQADKLIQLPALEVFQDGPADPPKKPDPQGSLF